MWMRETGHFYGEDSSMACKKLIRFSRTTLEKKNRPAKVVSWRDWSALTPDEQFRLQVDYSVVLGCSSNRNQGRAEMWAAECQNDRF